MAPSTATPKFEHAQESDERMVESWASQFKEQFESEAKSLGYIELEGATASVLPSSVELGFLRDARLRVVEPFHVLLNTEEDGSVVAEAEGLDEFGSGQNFSEAIADLQHALGELYFALQEQRDRLGQGLQKTFELLTSKVRAR